MKSHKFSLLVVILLLSGGIYAQETTRLEIEPNHSTIGFSIDIAGGATKVTGKFTDFELDFFYTDKDLSKSEARFVIQANSINTGISARDDHLRAADFFDVDRFPEIVFQSRSIKKTEEGYLARGILSMHGVDSMVDLPLKMVYEDGNTLGFEIRSKLNRIDFGVGAEFKHSIIEDFLAEEVDLQINFWTRRANRS